MFVHFLILVLFGVRAMHFMKNSKATSVLLQNSYLQFSIVSHSSYLLTLSCFFDSSFFKRSFFPSVVHYFFGSTPTTPKKNEKNQARTRKNEKWKGRSEKIKKTKEFQLKKLLLLPFYRLEFSFFILSSFNSSICILLMHGRRWNMRKNEIFISSSQKV